MSGALSDFIFVDDEGTDASAKFTITDSKAKNGLKSVQIDTGTAGLVNVSMVKPTDYSLPAKLVVWITQRVPSSGVHLETLTYGKQVVASVADGIRLVVEVVSTSVMNIYAEYFNGAIWVTQGEKQVLDESFSESWVKVECEFDEDDSFFFMRGKVYDESEIQISNTYEVQIPKALVTINGARLGFGSRPGNNSRYHFKDDLEIWN
jgi:hypothetical protein